MVCNMKIHAFTHGYLLALAIFPLLFLLLLRNGFTTQLRSTSNSPPSYLSFLSSEITVINHYILLSFLLLKHISLWGNFFFHYEVLYFSSMNQQYNQKRDKASIKAMCWTNQLASQTKKHYCGGLNENSPHQARIFECLVTSQKF